MKLKQIVCDKTILMLTKEKKDIKYGEVFEVTEARGKEILAATYKGKPVAEEVIVEDKVIVSKEEQLSKEEIANLKEDEVIEVIADEVILEDKPKKKNTKTKKK